MLQDLKEGQPLFLNVRLQKHLLFLQTWVFSSEVLSSSSIFDMDNFQNAIPNVEFAYNNALEYKIPKGFDKYNQLLRKLHES